jgi:glucose-1-phosphate adenylyltransferase
VKSVTTLVMAGGKGERLYPLTRDRAKPAVPFGGIYRIIDFTLSNCINSGMRHIYVLSQYKSLSLSRHIQQGWNILSGTLGEYVTVVPAQQRINEDWYKGTADAIFQNIYLLQKKTPDMVLILSGDHLYKMDYRELIHFHMLKGADVTVASVEMDKGLSNQLGVIEVDADFRIEGFQEKPEHPRTLPAKPDKILASMGVYVFNTEIMVKRLIEDAKKGSEHDVGKNILPAMVASGDRAFAFNFVDGMGETKYWRDVGTVEAYFEASMDLVSVCPLLNLYDTAWPIHTYHAPSPPAKTVLSEDTAAGGRRGAAYDSIIAGGSIISGGDVRKSIISANVRVDSYARVEDSILLDGVRVREGAQIRKAIVDKYSEIPEGMAIGYDLKEDMKNFTVTESGIVVVSKGFRLR